MHFYWVARRNEIKTFRWLLLVLPELLRAQLRHNRFEQDGPPQGGDPQGGDIRSTYAPRQAAASRRELRVTLFLTGCKPEECVPQGEPEPGSIAEMVTELQAATDDAGKPLVRIVASRPDWGSEFDRVKQAHRKETVGVVFCGAPAIAQALKQACELHTDVSEGTLFRLHKENF